jgi:hypothetical protein
MAIILIDFDNTITSSDENYPEISEIRSGAKFVINNYYDKGHCIIINTCRCGDEELRVEKYLIEHGVKFCHINQNCKMRINKYNNDTRKLGGHISIDDKDINSILHGIDWLDIYYTLDLVLDNDNMNHDICEERYKNI